MQAALYTHLAVPTVMATGRSPTTTTAKHAESPSSPAPLTVAVHGLYGASFYDRCASSSSDGDGDGDGTDGGVLKKRQDGAHCASLRDPSTGDIVRGLSEGGLRLFKPPPTMIASTGGIMQRSPTNGNGHALRSDQSGGCSSIGQLSSESDLGENGSPTPTALCSDEGAPSSWPSAGIDDSCRGSERGTLGSSTSEEKRSSMSNRSSNRSITGPNSSNSHSSSAIAKALDRVYLAGSGDLQTFASAELHFASTPSGNSSSSSYGAGVGAQAGPSNGSFASPSSPSSQLPPPGHRLSSRSSDVGPGDAAAAAVAAAHLVQDLDFVDQGSASTTVKEEEQYSLSPSSVPSTPGLWGGITVVEATCHRAANATWSDPTPSPDLLVASGRCVDDPLPSTKESSASGKSGPDGSAAAPLKPVICVGPGLVSQPVRGLMNGRITLTQIISFHE